VAHVLTGLYILAFSLGVVVVAFGALTYRRLRVVIYRTFAVLYAGQTLNAVAEGVRAYVAATGVTRGPWAHVVITVLWTGGNALLAWAIPCLAARLTSADLSRPWVVLHAVLAIATAGLAFAREALPGPVTQTVNYLAFFALYGYASVVLLKGFRSIEDLGIRRLTKRLLLLEASLALPSLAQIVLQYVPGTPDWLSGQPLVQLVFFFATVGLIIAYVMRSPEQAAASGGLDLPVQFVLRYGITPRECDIIAMMEKGHNNRQLAERLFISTRTVKNHVYHIYQKTGAANKMQLINLMRTFPTDGSGASRGPGGTAVGVAGTQKDAK
jgi:DNA-binding CsgD family transcriptional regulator